MTENVFYIDTHVGSEDFGRMRLAALLPRRGVVVSFDEKKDDDTAAVTTREWKFGGVTSRPHDDGTATMAFFGAFSGVRLNSLLNDENAAPEKLIPALQLWARAATWYCAHAQTVSQGDTVSGDFALWPGAVMVDTENRAALFLPAAVVKTEYAGDAALRAGEVWVHPDKAPLSRAALNYTLAVVLYRLFAGRNPFLRDDTNGDDFDTRLQKLHSDQREGVFVPLNFAARGINTGIAARIEAVLRGENEEAARELLLPLLLEINNSTKPFITTPTAAENAALDAEEARYTARLAKKTARRRFLARNKRTIIIAAALALMVGLAGGSIVKAQFDRPTTKGMTSVEVAAAYYHAYDALDSGMMEACAAGKDATARADISTAMNMFVLSKVREAYERTDFVLSPEEYEESGYPGAGYSVFGITKMGILNASENGENATVTVSYTLWTPAPTDENASTNDTLPPQRTARRDTLTLRYEKDRWRITDIERSEE